MSTLCEYSITIVCVSVSLLAVEIAIANYEQDANPGKTSIEVLQ
jgi:hypothetical protein